MSIQVSGSTNKRTKGYPLYSNLHPSFCRTLGHTVFYQFLLEKGPGKKGQSSRKFKPLGETSYRRGFPQKKSQIGLYLCGDVSSGAPPKFFQPPPLFFSSNPQFFWAQENPLSSFTGEGKQAPQFKDFPQPGAMRGPFGETKKGRGDPLYRRRGGTPRGI